MNLVEPKLGYVIPTLADRESLADALYTVLACPLVVRVILIKPNSSRLSEKILALMDDRVQIIDEARSGLNSAINQALKHLEGCDYWNWCGDDDKICPEGIAHLAQKMFREQGKWGSGYGEVRFQVPPYSFLTKITSLKLSLQRFGPNLIAQPPLLFDFETTIELGSINESYALAFDQDLIQSFAEMSKPTLVEMVTGSYLWHTETLSSQNRSKSQLESFKIRLMHAKGLLRKTLIVVAFPLSTSFVWSLHIFIKILTKRPKRNYLPS